MPAATHYGSRFPRLPALALLISASAAAQQASTPSPALVRDREPIEEIIITAERRGIYAQDLGLSVSAFSEDMLEAQNIQEVHDLQFHVPSFVTTGGASQITVRGIGTDITAPSADPGFGIHVDGVYQVPGAALLDYFDIERIEVLPGPQGSLGGRHTTGGSIYIWTNRPTPEWYFSGDVEAASYEKFRVRSVVNVPLGETLAVRVAALYEKPPYPLSAEPAGQRYTMNDLDGGALLRASLHWTPRDALVVDLIGTRTYIATSGAQWRYFGDYPAYPAGQSPLFFDSTPDYTNATPNPRDGLTLSQDRIQRNQRTKGWTAQLTAEWDLGPVVAKSISHYGEAHFSTDFDSDSSDLDIERVVFDDWIEILTQEISFASSGDGRFQWLFGGMWQSERPHRSRALVWDQQVNAAAANFVVLDAITAAPAEKCGVAGTDACVFTALPTSFPWAEIRASVRTDVAGAFANLSFELTERIRLIGGVRYNRTERDLHDTSLVNIFSESLDIINDEFCLGAIGVALPAAACFDALLGAPSGGFLTPGNTAFVVPIRGDRNIFTGNTVIVPLNRSWESVTGNARIELTPREDVLLYASFANASRAGGFNLVEAWAGHRGFGSETNRTYELGAKATLRERLRINAAAYWYDYENKTTTGFMRGFTVTGNAAQADVYGAELQLAWAASEALRLRGSVGWLSAEYASDFFAGDSSLGPDNPTGFDSLGEPGRQHGVARPLENLKGNPLTRSPNWTLALGGEYRCELGARGSVTARLDFAWRDEIYLRHFENPLDRQQAFTRTDLSLRWSRREDRGGWAELYVNNVENRKNVKTSLQNEADHRQWFLAAPRIVGIRVGWSWHGDEPPF